MTTNTYNPRNREGPVQEENEFRNSQGYLARYYFTNKQKIHNYGWAEMEFNGTVLESWIYDSQYYKKKYIYIQSH